MGVGDMRLLALKISGGRMSCPVLLLDWLIDCVERNLPATSRAPQRDRLVLANTAGSVIDCPGGKIGSVFGATRQHHSAVKNRMQMISPMLVSCRRWPQRLQEDDVGSGLVLVGLRVSVDVELHRMKEPWSYSFHFVCFPFDKQVNTVVTLSGVSAGRSWLSQYTSKLDLLDDDDDDGGATASK